MRNKREIQKSKENFWEIFGQSQENKKIRQNPKRKVFSMYIKLKSKRFGKCINELWKFLNLKSKTVLYYIFSIMYLRIIGSFTIESKHFFCNITLCFEYQYKYSRQ